MIAQLSPEEAHALLRFGRVARLGCVADGEPYVVPVNYLFQDGCAYLHSLPGRKVTALRANPRACLQVDDLADDCHWRSVLAYGNCEEITDPQERVTVLENLYTRFPLLTVVESAVAQDGAAPPAVVFRIRLDRITGVGEDITDGNIFSHAVNVYRAIRRRAAAPKDE